MDDDWLRKLRSSKKREEYIAIGARIPVRISHEINTMILTEKTRGINLTKQEIITGILEAYFRKRKRPPAILPEES
ncbi:MAG: hypothetical protein JWQ49_4587 [Edaphobacter sp.]|nr:hypothetical protein [Edaphobacter sp.]